MRCLQPAEGEGRDTISLSQRKEDGIGVCFGGSQGSVPVDDKNLPLGPVHGTRAEGTGRRRHT